MRVIDKRRISEQAACMAEIFKIRLFIFLKYAKI